MRDVTEAHFLHQRSGLEAVLRPPVPGPTALAWVPGREELVAAGRDGGLHVVDPVLGTRVAAQGLGEVSLLAIHPDRKRYLVANREEWILGKLSGGVDFRGKHGFSGPVNGFWIGEFAIFAGEGPRSRQLIIVQNAEERARIDLPARAVPVQGENDKLVLARSNAAGLEVVKFGKQISWSDIEATAHRLIPCGKHVIGLTQTGVAVWERTGGQPRSMRLPDLTAGDVSPDGAWLGLGTRTGAVALAAVAKVDARAKPHLVKAFDQAVTAVAFSARGQWLATAAEGLQIWTWEG
jgi:hypothetical protein